MDKKELHKKPFSVPPGYFEQLHGDIMARVSAEKLKERVPHDGFTLPEGYFDRLHHTIQQRTVTAVPVKTMRLRTWVSYAAAACVTIGISIAALLQLQQPNSHAEHSISRLSDTEIISYLEYYSEQGDLSLIADGLPAEPGFLNEQFSDEDIENYLNQTI
jgi:hypothetical protein